MFMGCCSGTGDEEDEEREQFRENNKKLENEPSSLF